MKIINLQWVSFIEKDLQVTNRIKLKFKIFNMSGLKSLAKIRRFFYKNTKAVLILFDYSRIETLNNINEWIEEARHFIKDTAIPYVLLGNKIDLIEDRESVKKEAENLANQYNCTLFDVSAYIQERV